MSVLQTDLEGAIPSRATISMPRGVTSSMPGSEPEGPGANPGEAAIFHSPLAQNKSGSLTN